MVVASIEKINEELLKYESLAEGIGDTQIYECSKVEKRKVNSNELYFEEENVYMYLWFNPNVKKVSCVFYLTEIDNEYVESLMSRIGLPTTEENIENYKRDPTMIDKFWNDRFIKKYNEIMKLLRKSKIKVQFVEKLKPTYNKNRANEIVL